MNIMYGTRVMASNQFARISVVGMGEKSAEEVRLEKIIEKKQRKIALRNWFLKVFLMAVSECVIVFLCGLLLVFMVNNGLGGSITGILIGWVLCESSMLSIMLINGLIETNSYFIKIKPNGKEKRVKRKN